MFKAIIIFLCLGFHSFAFSEELGLREVSQLFLQNSKQIQALKKKVEMALNEEQEAGRHLLPYVSWSNSVTDQQVALSLYNGFDFSPKKVFSSSLGFEQSIYLGGRIWRAWDIRRQALKIAKLTLLEQEQLLVTGVLTKAVGLDAAKKILIVLQESKKSQKTFVDLVVARKKRGAAKAFELAQARGDYFAYNGKINQQKILIKNLELQLKNDLNLKSTGELRSLVVLSPEAASLEFIGEQKLPEIMAAEEMVEMAKLEKRMAMGEHYPSLQLRGEWGYQAKEFDGLGDDLSDRHMISLSLNIPIFSGLTSVYIRRANEAKIASAKLNLKHKVDLSRMQKESVVQSFSLSYAVYEANKKWAEQAEKALSNGFNSFRLGVISTFQLVQLQRGYEGAKISYWSSVRSYYAEKLKSYRANGLRISESI